VAITKTDLVWQEGAPIDISALTFDGAGLSLTGSGTIDGPDTGILASGTAKLITAELSRFSGLLQRDIGGAASIEITGQTALSGGSFDIELTAQTKDLKTGEVRLDPVLAGPATVRLEAIRDASGLNLPRLEISSDHARISATGTLSSSSGQATIMADVVDLTRIEPSLSGPAKAEAALSWQDGAPIVLQHLRASGAGIDIDAEGRFDPADARQPVSGKLRANIGDLSRFNTLSGQSLAGQVSATVEGSATIAKGDFDLSLQSSSLDLAIGIAEVDRLLAGSGQTTAKLSRMGGVLNIEALDLTTPAAQLNAQSGGADTPINFDARLADIGVIAPDFSGPVTASGSAQPDGNTWAVALDAQGPGGITGTVRGALATDLRNADLSLTGTAPLGLANPFIAPRTLGGMLAYNLRLSGKPDLANLSGSVTTTGARLSAPTLHTVLTGIGANVTLGDGTALLDVSADVQAGGRVTIDGPLTLSSPFNAELQAVLASVTISDPTLYTTRVDGALSITGPLTAGGGVAGSLTLTDTEVQVPSGQVGGTGLIPGIVHLNEPASSRATRARAGLLAVQEETGSPAAPLGLELEILAPGRIFVRGRGLDAEFGGSLLLTGDTANIVPQGQFDLIRGRLDLLGKRFELTEGLIRIQGAFDPYISLVAETQNDTVTSRIIIDGPASDLDVRFASDPELPEDEVLAQLLFGRDLTTLSPFQLAQLASAVATLTGRGGEGVVAKLRSGIGLDDLDVTSSETGETEVRAGKYLSENLYSDIAVDSEGKTEVNLNLDLNPRIKLKGRVTNEGDTGVGIYYQRDY
jgi:translocation and assembly module TamB